MAAAGMMIGHPVAETTTTVTGLHGTHAALVEEALLEPERFGMAMSAMNGKPPVIQLETAVTGTWPTQETAMVPGMMMTWPLLTAALAVVVNGMMTGRMMIKWFARSGNGLVIPLVTDAIGTLME